MHYTQALQTHRASPLWTLQRSSPAIPDATIPQITTRPKGAVRSSLAIHLTQFHPSAPTLFSITARSQNHHKLPQNTMCGE